MVSRKIKRKGTNARTKDFDRLVHELHDLSHRRNYFAPNKIIIFVRSVRKIERKAINQVLNG